MVTTIEHPAEILLKYPDIQSQYEMRKNEIVQVLDNHGYRIEDFSTVVGRGGMFPAVKSGAYRVNDIMLDRLRYKPLYEHASNLGGIIAHEIAQDAGVEAYIYDSVRVDEMIDIARLSGMPEIPRTSTCHVLNSRAMAMKCASLEGKNYKDMNFVVAHLGGGISLSAHRKGRIIDIMADDEGPFSPERSGRVPCKDLIDLCYSGKYDVDTMHRKLRGRGGVFAYLGTSDAREVVRMIEGGNEYAGKVYEAMAYQVAKGIGEMSTVLCGEVDHIILTGGIAYSKMLTDWISERVKFISDVKIMAGENEMEALAYGVLRVLKGEETAWEYVE